MKNKRTKHVLIDIETHKAIKKLKEYKGYKTIAETIDMAIIEYYYTLGKEEILKK